MKDDLYTIDILSLAANIPLIGVLDNADISVRKTSKLCGSWHESDMILEKGYVQLYRQRLKACALGQASAALLGEKIIQASEEEVLTAYKALNAMLKHGAPPPKGRFEKLAVLHSVSDYPQRHASTLLPFLTASLAIKQLREKAPA